MSTRWAFNFTKWDPSHADILLATSCVQLEEKERLAKFVFKNDFKSSLIGRLMLRKFVSETTGLKYNEIKFVRDDKGKPFLENRDAFPLVTCNVSHHGDFAVLAGDIKGGLLGVDVMKIERPRGKTLGEYFRLMGRIFTRGELETIRGQNSERGQLGMYYRHWCLKESYVKAIGVGVTINLQDVSFKINSNELRNDSVVDDTELFFQGRKLSGWEFQEMLLDEEHCVAVAVNSKSERKNLFREIGFDELTKDAIPLLEPDEAYCRNFFEKSVKD